MVANYTMAFVRNARGLWVARVTRTNIVYPVQGADEAAQLANMQRMATAMRAGVPEVNTVIGEAVTLPPGVTPARATQTLFDAADSVGLEDAVLWEVPVEGQTLLDGDWMLTAGEALLAAL